MKFMSINDLTIHYRDEPGESSDTPALVFANSLGTDFRIWDDCLSALGARLAREAAVPRVICYDKRGHGLSDAGRAPYALGDHCSDLSGLLDALGVRKAIIIGLSVGGMIAQKTASEEADRVVGLVLSNTAHKIGEPAMWDDRIAAIGKGGIEALEDAILERWFSKAYRQNNQAEFRAWRNMLVRTSLDGYLGTCAAIRDADLSVAAASLKQPVLMIGGSSDGSTPPDLMRGTEALIANASLTVIEGPGHLPCIETPDHVASLIVAFMKENGFV